MIVEDEHQMRTLLALMLEGAGYRVLEAAHPNEAAHVWKREMDKVDVIVADIWLPGISGPELAAFFRRERPTVKCVFITGMANDIRAEFGKLIRNSEVVRKPFTSEAIVGAVSRALET
jgi:DNA-binding NtrC family response regulator